MSKQNQVCMKSVISVVIFLSSSFNSLAATTQVENKSSAQQNSQNTTTQSPLENTQVNPMTGKTLSEEQLNRALNRAKLQTLLDQETLKQAQVKGDLTLSSIKHEAEKMRMANETMPFGAPKFTAPKGSKVKGGAIPLPLPTVSTPRTESTAKVDLPQVATPTLSAPLVAQGQIEFGGETIKATSSFTGDSNQINVVDSQSGFGMNTRTGGAIVPRPPTPAQMSAPVPGRPF